jgi:hypothetical protein
MDGKMTEEPTVINITLSNEMYRRLEIFRKLLYHDKIQESIRFIISDYFLRVMDEKYIKNRFGNIDLDEEED